ncbi:galectin-4-like isoform X2 [Phyllobates terribilis]|uniref:galectin-4-like isoform X2 n=1 Tax=Phyllobates terribilis TaxID=111132 RepID=UPI003CCA784A
MAYVPAPGYQPAFNPPVLYTTVIAGGLRVGMYVVVKAMLPSTHNKFSIHFATGPEKTSGIALQMNAPYDGPDKVGFNSRHGEAWGTEEIKKEMPFKSGKVFNIMIEVTKNKRSGGVITKPQ